MPLSARITDALNCKQSGPARCPAPLCRPEFFIRLFNNPFRAANTFQRTKPTAFTPPLDAVQCEADEARNLFVLPRRRSALGIESR